MAATYQIRRAIVNLTGTQVERLIGYNSRRVWLQFANIAGAETILQTDSPATSESMFDNLVLGAVKRYNTFDHGPIIQGEFWANTVGAAVAIIAVTETFLIG